MENVEVILFWVTIFLYVGAFVSQIFGFINKKDKPLQYSSFLIKAGFIFHTATAIVHWIASKHPPVTDTYELNLTGVWFMIILFLLFRYLRKINEFIGLVILP
ncbi:MAG: hypothetical protein KAR14_03135, partial [Candidatus Aminicenantes bacterium]|nr:hypothetical protein [Candidatus Aminicenantes bacterium]